MTEPNDRTLVTQVLDGDREAFEFLVERHQQSVFNIALRISNDREDARDISQNVFVKACEKLSTYDHRFKFFSWLYRIAINESLNYVDKRRSRSEPDQVLGAAGRAPDEEYDRDQLRQAVQAAVMDLPPHYREVIVLRHFASLSYSDLSNVLSIPEKTVRSRLFTARRMLREKLIVQRAENP